MNKKKNELYRKYSICVFVCVCVMMIKSEMYLNRFLFRCLSHFNDTNLLSSHKNNQFINFNARLFVYDDI